MNNLNGIQIVRSSLLPERTMYVSEDVYQMLTETQEERKAKERATIQSILDHSTRVQELSGKVDTPVTLSHTGPNSTKGAMQDENDPAGH